MQYFHIGNLYQSKGFGVVVKMNLKYLLPGFLFLFSLFFLVNIAQAAVPARPESLSFECSADGTKVKLKWKRVFLASDYQLRVDKITGDIPEWFRSDKGDQNPKSDGSECPAGSLTTAGTVACQTLNITPNAQYEWSVQSLPTDSPANSKEGGPEFRCVPKAKPLQIAPISWNVKLSPVCSNGAVVTGIQTRVDFGVWPVQSNASKGIDWQSDQTKSGTHQIQIISTDNINNIYLKMFVFNDGWVPLELTKDLIDPNIKYGTFFGEQNTLTWKRNDFAEGNYTFKFNLPDSLCKKTLLSAPTTTSDAITSTPAEPSASPAQQNPSPAESSAPTVKKAVKVVVNNQDVTDKDFAKIKVTDSGVATIIDLRMEITYSDGSVDRSVVRFNYNPPAKDTQPTGKISSDKNPDGCTIPKGSSTCEATINWTVQNDIGQISVQQNGKTIINPATANGTLRVDLASGNNDFALYTQSTHLGTLSLQGKTDAPR